MASTYQGNSELALFVKKIMAIPFLPADLILPTYSILQIPKLEHNEISKLETFFELFQKQWLKKITPEELSIFNLENVTNNAVELPWKT